MFHHAARAHDGRVLFADSEEACALWARIVTGVPGIVALCLMPNHVHLLAERPGKDALGQALSAFVRWRNARHGTSGPLLQASGEPVPVEGPSKLRRTLRYIHLNPCRAGLVGDPVAWPWSTHLDAVGLAVDPVRPRMPDVHRFHRYVSSDPKVHVDGTDLPCPPGGLVRLPQLLDAVAAATRTPSLLLLQRRCSQRRLFLALAQGMTDATQKEIGAFAGVSTRSVRRVAPLHHAGVAALAADDRIRGWEDLARPRRRGWSAVG